MSAQYVTLGLFTLQSHNMPEDEAVSHLGLLAIMLLYQQICLLQCHEAKGREGKGRRVCGKICGG